MAIDTGCVHLKELYGGAQRRPYGEANRSRGWKDRESSGVAAACGIRDIMDLSSYYINARHFSYIFFHYVLIKAIRDRYYC